MNTQGPSNTVYWPYAEPYPNYPSAQPSYLPHNTVAIYSPSHPTDDAPQNGSENQQNQQNFPGQPGEQQQYFQPFPQPWLPQNQTPQYYPWLNQNQQYQPSMYYSQQNQWHQYPPPNATSQPPTPQASPPQPAKRPHKTFSPKQPIKETKTKQSNPDYPPSLLEYIKRCTQDMTEEQTSQVQLYLREKLTKTRERGAIFTTNWAQEPLPEITLRIQSQSKNLPDSPKLTKKQRKLQNKLKLVEKKIEQGANKAKKQKIDHPVSPLSLIEDRQKRFKNFPPRHTITSDFDINEGQEAITGTCQNWEKRYLRLTSSPDPSVVRPEPVLREALKMVQLEWKKNADWEWTTDQIKSIRQDLTVQNIKNEFTVKAYETHARLCLENACLGEFNTCQSQLKTMYAHLPGSVTEFTAYRILYGLYEESAMGTNHLLQELSIQMTKAPEVQHALKARQALAEKNFVQFFRLAGTAPHMGVYLFEFVYQKARLQAMHHFVRAYRPTLPVSYVQTTFKFESLDECRNWLAEHYVELSPDKQHINCREATSGLVKWEREWEEKHALSKES